MGTYEWDPVVRALELLRQATVRDPDFASALAAAGYCHAQLDAIGRVDDRVANRRAGIDCARRALRVAGDDAFALAAVAHLLGYFNEDIDTAIAIVDRALAINPSSAYGWRWSAFARLYAGRPDVARAHFETSLRLNPRGPRWVQLTGIGVTYFFERQFNDAVTALLTALQENPAYPLAHRMLAACFAHMGRIDEARDVVTRLRAITPVVIPLDTNYRNPDQRELFLSGLRLAMDETE